MKHRNFFRRQASQLGLAEFQGGREYGRFRRLLYLRPWVSESARAVGFTSPLAPPMSGFRVIRQSEKGAQLGKSDRAVVVLQRGLLFGAGKIFPRHVEANLNR